MDDGWWWHWWAAGDNRQATPGKPTLGMGLAWTLTWKVLMKGWSPATNKKIKRRVGKADKSHQRLVGALCVFLLS